MSGAPGATFGGSEEWREGAPGPRRGCMSSWAGKVANTPLRRCPTTLAPPAHTAHFKVAFKYNTLDKSWMLKRGSDNHDSPSVNKLQTNV